ncbi:MAG TPA: asparagine synthase (glutamine-hydrolyzing) [Candidatus Eisenbacteria bacterium]|nr:asparagine synthase (glutamine-hydrolyzing) [Candidatus Eisenbacteria bacterium]
MCGIAGILDRTGATPSVVERMGETIAHRGPDEATVHLEPGLGFAFRRLAIIDLVTGSQPVANEDESIWVMLNGEIYNYRELRAGLIERGHTFRTTGDTEVLAHLYEEEGPALVERLRGMFAFAIWDRARRRLFIARDHLGQKPLYWAERNGRLYFASEIKAILAAEPAFRAVDPQALDEYFTLRIIADPRSMFAGVHKLPPAHTLEADDKGVRVRRYWSLAYDPKLPIGEAEALEALDAEVRESVRLHLVSDVPVGAFLSGGVDSGIVAGMVHSIQGGGFKTFSYGLPYGRYDEAPAARAVASRYGTQHFEGSLDGDVVAGLPRFVYHLDEPSDPLSACLFHLAAFTRREVKVAVGGDGGDELFGGYDRYYGAIYARHYARLPRVFRRQVVRRVLDMAPDGYWYKSLNHQLRWLDELASVEGGRRYARSLSYAYFRPEWKAPLYTDEFHRTVDRFDAESSIIAWHDEGGAKEALDRMLLADTMVRLPNHSVMILDRMTMAHGLEARSPFLDHRLAEFAARLPTRLKVHGRKRRYLQMRLAERYMPADVLRRPKQGFSSALPYLMARQFRALFAHFLHDSSLVAAGYLREPAIASMLDAHIAGRTDHGNRLWLLLNAEVWHRVHVEQVPVDRLGAECEEAVRGATAEGAGAAART